MHQLYLTISDYFNYFLELPTAECFSFGLNTLLCDVITLAEDIGTSKAVITAQLELLENLSQLVSSNRTNSEYSGDRILRAD